MYNARLFYNKTDGTILRYQTIHDGKSLSIEDDIAIILEISNVPTDCIAYFEWDYPENELEQLMSEGKRIKVDVSQPVHTVYGVEPEPPEVVEPSDDDPIGGSELLVMLEDVL